MDSVGGKTEHGFFPSFEDEMPVDELRKKFQKDFNCHSAYSSVPRALTRVYESRWKQLKLTKRHENDLSTKKCTTILLIVEIALLVAAAVGVVFLALSGMGLLAASVGLAAAFIFAVSSGYTIYYLLGACKRERTYHDEQKRADLNYNTSAMKFVNTHIRRRDHFQNMLNFKAELDRRTASYIKGKTAQEKKEAERQKYVDRYGTIARRVKRAEFIRNGLPIPWHLSHNLDPKF